MISNAVIKIWKNLEGKTDKKFLYFC